MPPVLTAIDNSAPVAARYPLLQPGLYLVAINQQTVVGLPFEHVTRLMKPRPLSLTLVL
eukprot:SAG11_NODE_25751_length_354_cov_1.337255_2_plen_58_part_01